MALSLERAGFHDLEMVLGVGMSTWLGTRGR